MVATGTGVLSGARMIALIRRVGPVEVAALFSLPQPVAEAIVGARLDGWVAAMIEGQAIFMQGDPLTGEPAGTIVCLNGDAAGATWRAALGPLDGPVLVLTRPDFPVRGPVAAGAFHALPWREEEGTR